MGELRPGKICHAMSLLPVFLPYDRAMHRWARMQASVLTIQSEWRMYTQRMAYLQVLRAANVMQVGLKCAMHRTDELRSLKVKGP